MHWHKKVALKSMGCGSSAAVTEGRGSDAQLLHVPTLCFRGVTHTESSCKWSFSILIVSREGITPVLYVDGHPVRISTICVFVGTSLHRGDVNIAMAQEERRVTYSVDGTAYIVWVPAAGVTPNFLFYSCNGEAGADSGAVKFSEKSASAYNNTWNKVMERHHAHHFHVSIGGGDQLYCDDVLKLPLVAEWLELINSSRESGLSVEFSSEMNTQVKEFYFGRCLQHFHSSRNEGYAAALSSIPSVNMWDDHDIFDGFGSYEDDIQVSARNRDEEIKSSFNSCVQACKVMRGIFACARDVFRLFQLHIKADERAARGYFGDNESLSTILAAGDVAVVAIDFRSERTRSQVASDATYAELERRMLQMKCKHALCVVGIPILYPLHTTIHHVIDEMNPEDKNEFFGTLLKKLNKDLKQTGPFGEPENLDDLNDHWTSKPHLVEQLKFLTLLRGVAMDLQCRITILSGDVHTCCVQELQPVPQGPPLMVNIVTSGMRHSPMPTVVAAFVKKLPCQSDLALGEEGRWGIVPRQWQKVAGAGHDSGSYFPQRNFTEISRVGEEVTARLWLEVKDKNNEFSEYTYSFPFLAEGAGMKLRSHEDQ